ncbi:MAG: ribosome recycling factor [Ktedonobacterales bacterium]
MAEDVFTDVEHRMKGAVEALQRELQTVRTGRASPTLVERLQVEYYGDTQPLQNIAAIHAPDARTLTISPWDRKMLPEIEKAIQKSDLGLNPASDGTLIRIVIPALTEDRRRELVKVLHKKVDEAKVAVRNCRRDGHNTLREQERKKEISADELKHDLERLDKLTEKYITDLDKVGSIKEQEILAV